jgi:hypothetical protein
LNIQYKEGAATSTAVTDAVALRTSAETDYWRGTYELKRAWARFLYSTGKDLKDSYLSGSRSSEPAAGIVNRRSEYGRRP